MRRLASDVWQLSCLGIVSAVFQELALRMVGGHCMRRGADVAQWVEGSLACAPGLDDSTTYAPVL